MDEPRDAGDPGHDSSVVARLEAIERRLEALTERLDAITAPPPRIAPASERSRPSGVANPPSTATWPPRDRSDVARSPLAPAPLPPAADWQNAVGTAKDADDLEYKLGVTGLLRGGAVVVIVGIIYLVGLALSRGWVTPLAQFVGEIALCFGFVGFGYVKRQEREEFGGLLMGIGSCGLYLSFAGGHVFKELYPARIVVVLFLLLSLTNLGYAWWRASRSFWVIGIVGGLLAAAMPMREDRQTAALILHFTILIPAALIAARHRWSGMGPLLWVLATLALIPALLHDGAWTIRVGALYATALLGAWTSARGHAEGSFDPLDFVGLGLFATGALGLVLHHEVAGVAHIGLLGGATAALGAAFPVDSRERRTFLAWGAAIAAVLAPFALTVVGAAFAFGTLSLALSSLALRGTSPTRRPKGIVGLAWIELTLGIGALLLATTGSPPIPAMTEATLLLLLIAAAVTAAAANRTIPETVEPLGVAEIAAVGAGLVIAGGFVRLVDLAAATGGTGATHHQTFAFGTLLFAAIAAGVGLRARWLLGSAFGFGFALLGTVASLTLSSDPAAPGSPVELAHLAGAIGVVLFAAYGLAREVRERAMLTGTAVFAVWALLTRFVYVAVALTSDLRTGSYALTFAWIAFAAALIGLGFRRGARYLRYWGFGVFAATVAKVFLMDLSALDPGVRVAILLVLGLAMIGCGYWYIRSRSAAEPPRPHLP